MRKRSMNIVQTGLLAVTVFAAFSMILPGYSNCATGDSPKSITLVAGRVGSSNYAFIVGVANLISKTTGIKAVPEGGTYGKNLILLHRKEAEFILCNNDLAYTGARAMEDFKKYGKIQGRLMFSGSTSSPMVFVTRRDANIKSVADLKGKKVMCINPGNTTYHKGTDLFFEAAGITRADVQTISFSGHEDGDMALKEGRVAAYIHPQIVTSIIPFMQELNLQVPLRLVSSPEKNMDALLSRYPYFRKDFLPAKVYGEITDNKDLPGIGVLEIFMCHAALSDDLVYRVMKSIFDNLPELNTYTPMAKIWTENPMLSPVIPFHAGAVKYYKEKKMWTETSEARQKQLLTELGVSK